MHWLIRRLAHVLLTLILVSAGAFAIGRLAPGEFFDDLRLNPQIRPETLQNLRSRYGLDRPWPQQYGSWIWGAMRGNFGYSLTWQQPAGPIIRTRAGSTLRLTGTALAVAWLFGLPAGLIAARRPRGIVARCLGWLSSGLLSLPELLIIFLLILLFLRLGMNRAVTGFPMAVTCLAVGGFPAVFEHTRSAATTVMDAAFIRSARANGIRGFRLWQRYVLPAAAGPLISWLGSSFAGLVGGSLVVEAALGRPGLGTLLIEAIPARDLDLVAAVVLLSASLLALGNVLADLLLMWNDPRLRAKTRHG